MMMIVLTSPDGTEQHRVPVAEEYPGYDGWTVGDPEEWPTLARLQEQKKALVTALKILKQDGIVHTTAGAVQNDDRSKILIDGAFGMASAAKSSGASFSVNWTLADNSIAALDANGIIQMALEVGQYVAAVQDYSSALKAAIDAAASSADLDAIDINAGWP